MSDNAGTATTKKKTRKPLNYQMLTPRLDDDGEVILGEDGLPAGYDAVPTPPNVKKDAPRREDFDRGVRAALETGSAVAEQYNGKKLYVAAMADGFCYAAEVVEQTIRKVKITKA